MQWYATNVSHGDKLLADRHGQQVRNHLNGVSHGCTILPEVDDYETRVMRYMIVSLCQYYQKYYNWTSPITIQLQEAKAHLMKAQTTQVIMSGTIDSMSVASRTSAQLEPEEMRYYAVASRKRPRV